MEPTTPRRGRKRADEAFLAAIACGASIDNAAAKAGFSKRTGFRRLQDPDFRKRLAELKADTVRRGAAMLTAATLEAIKTLLDLQSPSAPAATRLGAARTIIELGVRLRESNDIEERLAALEKEHQANR